MNFVATIGAYTLGIGIGQQNMAVITLGAVWTLMGTVYELHNLNKEDWYMTLFIPSDHTVAIIMASTSFKSNALGLASELKTTKEDAGQEIMYELMAHRLTEDIDIMDMATSKLITFARKAVRKAHFDAIKTQQLNEVSSNTIDIENIADNVPLLDRYDIDNDTFNTIVGTFHSTQYELVGWLLTHGEEKTKEHFGDTPMRFNQKMKRLLKYVDAHKATFEANLEMSKDKDMKQVVEDINQFFRLYEADPYLISNLSITEYFEEHQDTLAFTLALDKVHYQGKLFDDWRHYPERTEFLLELNNQQQVLLAKLYPKTAWVS